MDNSYGGLVKRMIYNEEMCRVFVIAHIIELVGATESNCLGVNEFIRGMPMCQNDKRCICHCYKHFTGWNSDFPNCPNMIYHGNAVGIQVVLAKVLKNKLPNVINFDLDHSWMPSYCTDIFLNILLEYQGQTTDLKFQGSEIKCNLICPKLTSITYLNIDHFDEDGRSSVTHPQILRKIKTDFRNFNNLADYYAPP
ncbi:hypothetical protein BX667DRAFT_500220 [Coemansia mojavensis]|nr:hypothetical protein BX667DRAFT_500220 [Coemansia mojavensis]